MLHARVRDYDPAWTEALLYERRALFETHNKGLSLLPTEELPWYRIAWTEPRATTGSARSPATRKPSSMCSSGSGSAARRSLLDFERKVAVDWYWGPTNEVRAALEALGEAGVIGLARRDGNRRYYDLVERLFPAELLAHRPSPRDQLRHKLLSRHRGHGLLGTGGQAELWYGTGKGRREDGDDPDLPTRGELRAELVERGDLVPVEVEGVRGPRFALGKELPLLEEATRSGASPTSAAVTFIAPLDPLAWDRDLLRQLFDFDYVWEVYVSEAKRRWGYYVLPILYGDRFVGRFEPRVDRAGRVVRILNAWWEPWFDPRRDADFVPAMRDALAAYLRFARARSVEWAPALARERRLFGVRPRSSGAPRPDGASPPGDSEAPADSEVPGMRTTTLAFFGAAGQAADKGGSRP